MLRALFSRAKQSPVRGVQLYFSARSVIVAPLHQNLDGIYFEQALPLVLDGLPAPERLGAAFQEGFGRFSVEDRNLRNAKRSDWPAFRASGARSVAEFEKTFRPMQCFGLNASNAVVRASTPHPAHDGIELSVSFNPLLAPEAVGEKLLQLARVAHAI